MVLSSEGRTIISGSGKEVFFEVAMIIRAFYDTTLERGLTEHEAMEVIAEAGKCAFSEEFNAMLSERK